MVRPVRTWDGEAGDRVVGRHPQTVKGPEEEVWRGLGLESDPVPLTLRRRDRKGLPHVCKLGERWGCAAPGALEKSGAARAVGGGLHVQ